MFNSIKTILKSTFRPEPQKSVVEVVNFHRENIEEDRYPESDKYFEAAKKLLEKYPVEQWRVEPGFLLTSSKIKHNLCEIEFIVMIHYDGPYLEYAESVGKMTPSHGRKLYEEFRPLFDEMKAKYERELKERNRQFEQKLEAALS